MTNSIKSPARPRTFRVYAFEKVYYNIDIEAASEKEAARIAREEKNLIEWDREPFEDDFVIYEVRE